MDSQSPEVIELQMEETRQALTEKVSALEQQVVDTVQSTTQAVQDTVETVKSAIQDTVGTVKDSVQESVTAVKDNVKDTLDVTQHVQNHPWATLGAAVMAGLVTGLVVFRKRDYLSSTPRPLAYPPDSENVVTAPAGRTGFVDDLIGLAGLEAKQLAREAVATAAQTVREQVLPSVLEWVTQGLARAMERPAPASEPWQTRPTPATYVRN